ncbi:hypothetical protein SEA_HIRKO_73 [Arthrobacter phage Hirko]|nr:hypothetical protein SEA_HIRKO_73 [Arthrobacter phage Hirko]
MADPSRWQVEGATPEAQALIEDLLTDDVMSGIETEAAGEAARRALYGADGGRVTQQFGPNPVERPAAWLSDGRPAPYTPGEIPADAPRWWLTQYEAPKPGPVGAGRHLAVSGRGHGKTAAAKRWLSEATGLNYRGR